ncbi:ankyrin repeat-containing domain protein [Chaetomium sp. MPI-CAGE-AT-0009]|nr:ankyrin repeat-containing domain protein [Chaetomium sp. MPI-CAGE-AT-0009]
MTPSSVPVVTQAPSVDEAWQKALDRLDPDLRKSLTSMSTRRFDVVGAVLRAADDKRQLCIRKQWKFTTPGGKVIVVRDVLEKIVGWINRYKAVGDVASQFDPGHAALPWAAFRFLLNAACGDVQAFGLVVTVLETIARIMARSKVIEEVYIRGPSPTELAQSLEEALILLFADALMLLAKCVKYFGRSTRARALLSAAKLPISDDDLTSLTNREAEVLKLAVLADTKILRGIDTKIEALSNRTTNTFADLDEKLIRLVDTSVITQKALEEDKLKDLLGWLSLVPVARHHKDVAGRRLQGSAAWLIQHPDFRDFLSSSSSSILLLHGVRGCGKSTAFSAVVDHLLPQPQPNTAASPPCAYFYCQNSPSEPERASPACILRSLVRQLAIIPVNGAVKQVVVSAYEKETKVALKTREEPSKPTVDECIRHILDLTSANPAYICLDAVDELSEPDRACVIEALRRVVSESASVVKVFLTARDNTQLHALLESEAKIRVTPADNKDDVKAFVQMQVEKVIHSRRLLNGTASTELVNKISEVLLNGSGEMFLWVKLQLDFLCRKKSEQDILKTLEHGLSAHLDQIYDHVLHNILALGPVAKRVALQVISWLLFARRTLQPGALFSILGLHPDLQLSKPEKLNIVDVCHNLVMLDGDTNAISFCHSSIRDFMLQQDIFRPASAHQLLATACVRQCTAGPGIIPFVPDPSPIQDFYHYAAVYWPEHVYHSEATATDTSSDLVSHETLHFIFAENIAEVTPAFIVWLEWIRETGASLPLYHPLKLPFSLVPNPSFSPVHAACVFGVPTILSHLINANPSPTESLSEPNSDAAQHRPLYLAAAHGHTKVITLILSQFPDLLALSLSTPCGAYGTPLNVAAFRGHEGVVRALLDHLDLSLPVASAGEVIKTALTSAYSHACRGGRERAASLLAKESHRRLGFRLWDTEQEYDQMVKEAVTAGFRDLVEWLMGREVKPKATPTSEDYGKGTIRERNLLLVGIKKGQVAVVRALLRMGQKWKEAIPEGALALAAVTGHEEMVSYLHDEVGGMNLEAEGPFGTALRSASLMGYDRVVRLLLSWGADPTASGRLGSALQAAAQNGHTEVMRLLIDKGADCNQPGPPRGTSLQAAAYYGHRDAVALLLDWGADMYQEGKSKDALHAAIAGAMGRLLCCSWQEATVCPLEKKNLRA